MRRPAALYGLVVALALVVVWELSGSEPGSDATGTTPAVTARKDASRSGQTPALGTDAEALARIADSVTERPLFSVDRRPGRDSAAGGLSADARDGEPPRLTGVIVGPAGGRAIFAGSDGKPRSVAVGDVVGRYTVRTIDPGLVTLSGPDGDHLIHPNFSAAPSARLTSQNQGNPR